MKRLHIVSILLLFSVVMVFCENTDKRTYQNKNVEKNNTITAKDILGNPEYLAMCYGGYRETSRDIQPSLSELKEDLKILQAMGVKIIRTYNVHFPHAENILKAITALKSEDPKFEMYLMLGAWIDCKNAFNWENGEPDHRQESERNPKEIAEAVRLAKSYPDLVKIIAVGNEAMVKWATSYYVEPWVILKWVNHLQELKASGELPKDLWITSSDNFASWGGGTPDYHVEDLNKLIKAVDYVSMHTYPMHDTHYNPVFWNLKGADSLQTKKENVSALMLKAKKYAVSQYDSVKSYMKSIGVNKPIHIGETGWASVSGGLYGNNGSKATDEYKQALYYEHMRQWTSDENMACFYFEAFDEPWKDAENPKGSENHFGLFTANGKAKYALWNLVDEKKFEGLSRNGNTISKTYNGDESLVLNDVKLPMEITMEKKAMH